MQNHDLWILFQRLGDYLGPPHEGFRAIRIPSSHQSKVDPTVRSSGIGPQFAKNNLHNSSQAPDPFKGGAHNPGHPLDQTPHIPVPWASKTSNNRLRPHCGGILDVESCRGPHGKALVIQV